ncbi:hypothetical protein OESDEN_23842, partial [Oesophagostomum dentatum]
VAERGIVLLFNIDLSSISPWPHVYVFRILPEKWVTFLDPYLYPTCPAKPPPQNAEESNKSETAACCAGGETAEELKKDL